MDLSVQDYVMAGMAVLLAAGAIAKLTPTKRDDVFIERLRRFLEKLSVGFLPDRKEK